jgi:UPF0716 protein FxsA
MSVAGRLALLFVVVSIVELVLLIQVGRSIGLWPTLALVLATGAIGATLARIEGMRVIVQFQRELASGRMPGQALLDGICVLIGGAFLLTPGVLTDLAGLSLLVPLSRRWIQRRLRRRLERAVADGTVRVATMGAGGIGMWGMGGSGAHTTAGRRPGDPTPASAPRLDPSKGIVIEPDDNEVGP